MLNIENINYLQNCQMRGFVIEYIHTTPGEYVIQFNSKIKDTQFIYLDRTPGMLSKAYRLYTFVNNQMETTYVEPQDLKSITTFLERLSKFL